MMQEVDRTALRLAGALVLALLPASAAECDAIHSGAVRAGTSEASRQAAGAPRRRLHGVPALFTHPPTAIVNVTRIVPLGNANGVDHIIPVDHMYLRYPHGPNGGADTVPLQAMAAGELVMVARQIEAQSPGPDYSIFIRHTARVTSQYEHVHELAARVMTHLASTGSGWVEVSPGFTIMFLGQLGAPDPLPLAAGETVGATRSYSESWDLGVIDADTHGVFVGNVARHYPALDAYTDLLGIVLEHAPFAGQATRNAGCFLNYLTPELRSSWSALLADPPGNCGRADWDLDGRVRGTWFNPAFDTTEPPPLFDDERAALAIVPYNLSPATDVQITIPSGHPLAAVDPAGAYPQLRRRFVVAMDRSAAAHVNPDPATVTPETGTVCYDLRYPTESGERFNALLLRLARPRELRIAYDPAPSSASRCAALLAGATTAWITTYVR